MSGKVVAIIQARMGSTRLPEKVLMDLAGKPVIRQVYNRASRIEKVDEVVVATTAAVADDKLAQYCKAEGIKCLRGSEADVLDRFYLAARAVGADHVIRITGDCPLLDPKESDKVVNAYLSGNYDYVSNTIPATLPDGLDTEMFSFAILEEMWKKATLQSEREHVTMYVKNRPEEYNLFCHRNDTNYSKHRWTLDEDDDFKLINELFDTLAKRGQFGYLEEILSIFKEKESLLKINEEIGRDEGLQKSVQTDRTIINNTDFTKSGNLLTVAKEIIPSASQTYSKSYSYFCEGAAPAFMEKGEGARVWDVDGNEYVDYILALGPVTIGYNDPGVNKAIRDQLEKGILFSQPIGLEVKLAKKLVEVVPCAESVRFVKSGSDATSAAIRLARAFTGNEIILSSGYHGWQDWYIGSTENDLGVPQGVKDLIKEFDYNDLEGFKKLVEEYDGGIAGVILEPSRVSTPDEGFLEGVAELTKKSGGLLIFDEVVTGFRLSLGGAQNYFGVTPDLAAIGKGMANGMALSAVVGRKDIMSYVDKGAFLSMTFGGEALSLAASLATIDVLQKDGVYDELFRKGQYLIDGAKKLVEKYSLEEVVTVKGLPVDFGILFNEYGGYSTFELLSVFQQEMIRKGVLFLGVNYMSVSHTQEDLDLTLEAYDEGFCKVRALLQGAELKDLLRGEVYRPVFKRIKK